VRWAAQSVWHFATDWTAVLSSILCVQTSSEAHPASYPMGAGVSSQGVESGRSVTLTTHPYLVPRSRMSSIYNSSPSWCVHGVAGQP
jgi:hypothetical protein